MNPKTKRGHLLVMTNLHTKFEDPRYICSQVINHIRFIVSLSLWPRFWPRHLKFNKSHLLAMTIHYNKFEDPRSMCSQVIDRSRFWATMSLWIWLWPRNPKFNSRHLLVMSNHHTIIRRTLGGYEFFSYWSDKVCLRTKGPTDGSTIHPLLRRGHY